MQSAANFRTDDDERIIRHFDEWDSFRFQAWKEGRCGSSLLFLIDAVVDHQIDLLAGGDSSARCMAPHRM